jgi:hypothetical protein
MKRFQTCLALGLLATSTTAAAIESQSLNRFTPHVLPVLVQVDAKGKVTNVSPAMELSPKFDKLLRSSLDEMIHQPAMVHNHPTASQFVITLALRATPRDDGRYDAKFAYVSVSPVPSGQWVWSHEDGHRLALVDRDSLQRWHQSRFNTDRDFSRMVERPYYPRSYSSPAPASATVVRAATRGH